MTTREQSIKPKPIKPIVLLGMMGVGKSRVGQELAKVLGVSFYDSDFLIERQQNLVISQIFEEKGEIAFRELEKKKIEQLLENGFSVISTGGGAVVVPETLSAIKSKAVSVWLNSDIDSILKRVKIDTKRPLLRGGDPRSKLEELFSARETLYAQADIHIDNSSKTIQETIDTILQELET